MDQKSKIITGVIIIVRISKMQVTVFLMSSIDRNSLKRKVQREGKKAPEINKREIGHMMKIWYCLILFLNTDQEIGLILQNILRIELENNAERGGTIISILTLKKINGLKMKI